MHHKDIVFVCAFNFKFTDIEKKKNTHPKTTKYWPFIHKTTTNLNNTHLQMHSQLVSIYKPLYSLERRLNKHSILYSEFKFLTVFSKCLAVNTSYKKISIVDTLNCSILWLHAVFMQHTYIYQMWWQFLTFKQKSITSLTPELS